MGLESDYLWLSCKFHIIPYLDNEKIRKSIGMIIYADSNIYICLQNFQNNAFFNSKKKFPNQKILNRYPKNATKFIVQHNMKSLLIIQ